MSEPLEGAVVEVRYPGDEQWAPAFLKSDGNPQTVGGMCREGTWSDYIHDAVLGEKGVRLVLPDGQKVMYCPVDDGRGKGGSVSRGDCKMELSSEAYRTTSDVSLEIRADGAIGIEWAGDRRVIEPDDVDAVLEFVQRAKQVREVPCED